MGNAEDVEVVRRGYEAFNAGDMATLHEIFSDDAVWHVAGNNSLSGTKQGRDAILAYFGELGTRSGGTLKVNVLDVVGGENHTVGIQRNVAEKEGMAIDLNIAIAFEVLDGKIVSGREFIEDSTKNDQFWG